MRGTDRDTPQFAAIRRKALTSLTSSVLVSSRHIFCRSARRSPHAHAAQIELAPELLALVEDLNSSLWGLRNTMHALGGVLRGTHRTASFLAEATHDIATAPTSLAGARHWNVTS